jgi:L-fuculose-phosphate aldolase
MADQSLDMLAEAKARRTLIEAGLILEHQGQGDMTRGHVSLRLPGRPDRFLMKPHSIGFDEITAENILTIDLDGEVVAGTARRHSEVYIHSEIFRARPDIQAVIHAHPVHAVALSHTGRALRPLSQGGAVFADALPEFTGTIDLIRRPDQGRALAAALGPHFAVLMRGHGVAVCGATLEQAVVLAVMLDEAARIQLLADAAGGEVPLFPPEDVAALREKLMSPEQFVVNFDYLARKARRFSSHGGSP